MNLDRVYADCRAAGHADGREYWEMLEVAARDGLDGIEKDLFAQVDSRAAFHTVWFCVQRIDDDRYVGILERTMLGHHLADIRETAARQLSKVGRYGRFDEALGEQDEMARAAIVRGLVQRAAAASTGLDADEIWGLFGEIWGVGADTAICRNLAGNLRVVSDRVGVGRVVDVLAVMITHEHTPPGYVADICWNIRQYADDDMTAILSGLPGWVG